MTSSPDTWMPFYMGDFKAATSSLTHEEKWAYLELIWEYWREGHKKKRIIFDKKMLKNISGISGKKLDKILAFFDNRDGYLYHSRIEKEILKAKENKEVNTERAKKAAEARWGKSNAPSNAPSIPQAKHEDILGECPPPLPITTKPTVCVNIPAREDVAKTTHTEDFEKFKEEAMRSRPDLSAAQVEYEFSILSPKYTKNHFGWLRQAIKWKHEPPTAPPWKQDDETAILPESWRQARQVCRQTLCQKTKGESVFNNWIRHLEYVRRDGNCIILAAPTRFVKEWIINNHLADIAAAWREVDNSVAEVALVVLQKLELVNSS